MKIYCHKCTRSMTMPDLAPKESLSAMQELGWEYDFEWNPKGKTLFLCKQCNERANLASAPSQH